MTADGAPRSTYGAGGLLDYPHYTRPAEFRGVAIPEVSAAATMRPSGAGGGRCSWRRHGATGRICWRMHYSATKTESFSLGAA